MSYDFHRDMSQWADIEGEFHPDNQWLLSSADTWHKNPHYKGEPQPHPDDEVGENNQEPDEVNGLGQPLISSSEGVLVATRDNIKHEVINFLALEGAVNETLKHIIDENFKRIGVVSP